MSTAIGIEIHSSALPILITSFLLRIDPTRKIKGKWISRMRAPYKVTNILPCPINKDAKAETKVIMVIQTIKIDLGKKS
ncbi:hypothetical protein [Cryomorpha ignava]|uniref:hypothetical protein n=1 Tax=Cryomorpha ignava TaxID=101383 RepID=UPI001953F13C|nr:hypothetical protein [Cryomorpha ignava]